MRVLGLDYGSKTVGVAISDPLGITAQGVETIWRKQENHLRQTLARIEELVSEYHVEKIVLFATSGGSGFGNTVKELQSSAPDAVITEGRLLNCGTKQEISEWVNSL